MFLFGAVWCRSVAPVRGWQKEYQDWQNLSKISLKQHTFIAMEILESFKRQVNLMHTSSGIILRYGVGIRHSIHFNLSLSSEKRIFN